MTDIYGGVAPYSRGGPIFLAIRPLVCFSCITIIIIMMNLSSETKNTALADELFSKEKIKSYWISWDSEPWF